MSDTPEQFVIDVLRADGEYAHNLSVDTFLGNFRVETLGFTKESLRPIAKAVLDVFVPPALDKMDSQIEVIEKIVKHPPECIDDEDTYQGVQYIATVEAPYAQALVDSTFLKDEVTIPPGTDEFLLKLSKIPRCNGT
jgi:hypothetical protein